MALALLVLQLSFSEAHLHPACLELSLSTSCGELDKLVIR
jgi:hypothetical protein